MKTTHCCPLPNSIPGISRCTKTSYKSQAVTVSITDSDVYSPSTIAILSQSSYDDDNTDADTENETESEVEENLRCNECNKNGQEELKEKFMKVLVESLKKIG